MRGPSQCDKVLRHMQEIGPITPLEALQLYQCMRLGGRINDLKHAGHKIQARMVLVDSGKYVAEYRLLEQQNTLIFEGNV